MDKDEKKRIKKQIDNYRIYIKRNEKPSTKRGKGGTNMTPKPERNNRVHKYILSPKRLQKLRNRGGA